MGFGAMFDTLPPEYLAKFCYCLSQLGLKQEDILKECVAQIQSQPDLNFSLTQFPVMRAILALDVQGPLFGELVAQTEKYHGKSLFELFQQLNLAMQMDFVHKLLALSLEGTIPKFTEMLEEI